MPIIIPAPVLTPEPLSEEALLASPYRVSSFRCDLLANLVGEGGEVIHEGEAGVLLGVTGGSLTWESRASIKGRGSLAVLDLDEGVDWTSTRIRISAILSSLDGVGEPSEYALGVYVPSAPREAWSGNRRRWDIELLDKNLVLDQDTVTDAAGMPVTYSVAAGANVVAAVVALIEGAGESAVAIEPATKVLANPMTWDMDTPRLKIINDLLDAAGYFSLWVDGHGQYRVTPYQPPQERGEAYALIAPFTEEGSLLAEQWTRDRDYFNVPNRFVAISPGDEYDPALVSVVTNVDPASPFSYPSRGRWITETETGVEAVDQAALDIYARRQLAARTSVSSTMEVQHLLLPDLRVNSVVRFRHAASGLDAPCVVTSTTIPLSPLGLSSSTLQDVTTFETQEGA